MRLWRISTYARFDGEGARRFGGRWNRPGTAVVYAGATLALATLEFLVHVDRSRAPGEVIAHHADMPDDVTVERIEEDKLPAAWTTYPAPEALRDIGTRWAAAASSLLLSVPTSVLRVPSALIPTERNYLINPSHPEFARVRARSVRIRLDPRVWKGRAMRLS